MIPVLKLKLSKACAEVNPESVRFALKRCQNESTNSSILKRSIWDLWEFPNDKQTHCYIKCFLNKLGLINIYTRGLRGDIIIHLLQQRGFKIKPEEIPWLDGSLDGTCRSYYNKWMAVKNVFGIKLKISLFSFTAEGLTNFYDYAISKPDHKTATQFCIKFARKYLKNRDLSILSSRFKKQFTGVFQCHLLCIYKYFHYFDGYGRVDPKEIILSIIEANQLSSVQTNSTKHTVLNEQEMTNIKIEKCSHRANLYYNEGGCKTAYILHMCLHDEIENYEQIFKSRDEITYYY